MRHAAPSRTEFLLLPARRSGHAPSCPARVSKSFVWNKVHPLRTLHGTRGCEAAKHATWETGHSMPLIRKQTVIAWCIGSPQTSTSGCLDLVPPMSRRTGVNDMIQFGPPFLSFPSWIYNIVASLNRTMSTLRSLSAILVTRRKIWSPHAMLHPQAHLITVTKLRPVPVGASTNTAVPNQAPSQPFE